MVTLQYEWSKGNTRKVRNVYKNPSQEWLRARKGFEKATGSRLQCKPGCSDCCHVTQARETAGFEKYVTVFMTSIEAARLWEILTHLPYNKQLSIIEQHSQRQIFEPVLFAPMTIKYHYQDACPLLDPSGRCYVYAGRPLMCRSIGLPVREHFGGVAASTSVIKSLPPLPFQYNSLGCPKNSIVGDDDEIILYDVEYGGPKWALRWLDAVQTSKQRIQKLSITSKNQLYLVNLSNILEHLKEHIK